MEKKPLDQQPWRYTREEQERLRALTAPRLLRPFTYFDWLVGTMPGRTAIPLFLGFWSIITSLVVIVIYEIIKGIQWAWMHTPSGVLWFILGAVLALGIRAIIQDAVATECRVRHSTQDKNLFKE